MRTRDVECGNCHILFTVTLKRGGTPRYCSEQCRKAKRYESTKKWVKNNPDKRREQKQREYKRNRDSILQQKAKYRSENRDQLAEYSRDWRAKNRERHRAYSREYREKNPERTLKTQREWRKANKEKMDKYRNDWIENHPESYKASRSRRRYRRRVLTQEAFVEDVNAKKLLESFDMKCGICGGEIDESKKNPHPLSLHIDHIVPLSKGGEHSYANCQPAHASCNIQKGTKLDGWQDIKPIVDGEESHYHS